MALPPVSASGPGSSARATASAPGASPRLKKAATEFEGMLIATLWKGLMNDPLSGNSDPAAKSMEGLGLQAMSTAIAQRGGLGLAKMVERELTPKPPVSGHPAAQQLLKWTHRAADMPLESELGRAGGQAKMLPLRQRPPAPSRPLSAPGPETPAASESQNRPPKGVVGVETEGSK